MRRIFIPVILAILAAVFSAALVNAQNDPLEAEGVAEVYQNPRIVWLKLGDDIGEDTEALTAMVERLPSWKIGGRPDYQIVRDPEFFEDFILVRVKRDIWKAPRAYREILHRTGPMDISAITEFYSVAFHQQEAWASNVPQPIYLGPISDSGFEEQLRNFAEPIAITTRLLALKHRTTPPDTSICLSTEIPFGANCPMRSPQDFLEVPREADFAMKIRLRRPDRRFLHVLAIAPDNTLRLLFTRPPFLAPANATEDDSVSYRYSYIDTGDIPVRFDQAGVYHVLTIASEHSLDPYIFGTNGGSTYSAPGEVARTCVNPLERRLCDIIDGTSDPNASHLGDTNVTVSHVYSTEPQTVMPVIVNGRLVARADALWQVQLFKQRDGPALGRSGDRGRTAWRQNFEKAHQCGASYLGGGFVLTAAHCFNKRGQVLYVRMGTLDIANGGRAFRIASIVTHKSYATGNDYDDIALLRIDSSQMNWAQELEREGRLAPIALDTRNLGVGQSLLVTGWGQTNRTDDNDLLGLDNRTQRNPRRLLGADLRSISDEKCQSVRGFAGFSMTKIVCAGAPGEFKDACFGDSGGPLTRRSGTGRVLVGIVSVGEGCALSRGAGGLYTRVSAYGNWIERAKRVARRPGRFDLSD